MRKVEAKIEIRVSPEKTLSAFTDPAKLRGWWGVERELIELIPGGMYSLAWKITKNGFGYVSTGIVREYQPGHRLRIENMVYFNPEVAILGPMSLLIEAREKGKETELYVRQEGYQEGKDWDWYYEAVLQAWPEAVKAIKNYLE